jgi:hypothetical protein
MAATTPCHAQSVSAVRPHAAQVRWEKLFNGRNLDGWEVAQTGRWTVEDGAIVMRRLPHDSGGGWLVTKRDFGNFILRVKFQPGNDDFNTGILIRDPGHAKTTRPALNGFEIKLAQGDREENANATIWYVSSAYLQKLPAKEWTEVEIRCEGDHITTFLNGRKMAETHSRRSYRGAIGFHLHGGQDQPECRWKDVELQELPDTTTGFQLMEEKLVEAPGTERLLPGEELPANAMQEKNGHAPSWSVRDGVLKGDGTGGQSWLMLPERYRDFVLSFNFRVSSHGDGGVVFRADGQENENRAPEKYYEFHMVDEDTVDPSASVVGVARAFRLDANLQRVFRPAQWNLGRIYVSGDHILTYLNLQKEGEAHDGRSREEGRIGFRVGAGASIELRNITVKGVGSSDERARAYGLKSTEGK